LGYAHGGHRDEDDRQAWTFSKRAQARSRVKNDRIYRYFE